MLMKVQITKRCWVGGPGEVKQINAIDGKRLIEDRFAVEVDEDRAAREDRQKESQAAQDKAFKERDKRIASEEKAKAKEKSRNRGKRVKTGDIENKSLSASA